jgi:hypothetical protein
VTIRVALLDLPGLLGDVVRDALSRDGDIQVQVHVAGSSEADIMAGDPAVIVLSERDPQSCPHGEAILRGHHDLRLVAISPDARQACLYEWCPCGHPFDEVSASTLRAAVRGSAGGTIP